MSFLAWLRETESLRIAVFVRSRAVGQFFGMVQSWMAFAQVFRSDAASFIHQADFVNARFLTLIFKTVEDQLKIEHLDREIFVFRGNGRHLQT